MPGTGATSSSEPSGFRRLYKAAEDAIGPRLPRPLRQVWRRLIGRPPLPARPEPNPSAGAWPQPPAGFDVVCFPIIAWSFRFQRPQQLARELGRRGHRVFWVDPDAVKQMDARPAGRAEVLAPNVFSVGIAASAPRDPFRDALDQSDADTLLDQLRSLERHAGLAGTVALVQLPFWAPLAQRAAEELGWTVVYDCMDDHAAFSTNSRAMLEGERWLLEQSALVLTTSRRLRERAEADARRVVAIPNACDYEHFARAAGPLPRPPEIAELPGPIVGYVGAISEWFDFDLLRHAVRTHPEWSFVLVGSTWGAGAHEDLLAAPNVHLVGERPYDELPAWLAAFDVACIPFALTPLIEATDPVKLYEYLAAEKPVVASRLPELEAHTDLVILVDSAEAFTAAVEQALERDGEQARATRRAFARAHTWTARGQTLEAALEASFPRASVCVVTWNNLELTRACLESVLRDGTWPALELIVIDNASTDGTQDYLRALAGREARLRVELNPENRGFAAANNQALSLATGEYVALLNNDTVVPRGWLARLIRVLEQDRRIGLVGPVTDGVWNEARVEGVRVGPDDLPAFADEWAREHHGRVYPIGMLAMYCVVARRTVIDAVGPLDERFGIGMFEDDDYAHRVRRAGFRLACAEEVFVHHAGQASFDKLDRKDDLWEENRAKFEQKWETRWRPPGLGTRARTLALREEIERQLAGQAGKPIVWLATSDGENAALVRRLERPGHVVIEVHEPPADPARARVERLGPHRLASYVPLEAFDFVRGAIVVACTARAFDVAYFADPRLVYVDEPAGPAHLRKELRERAQIVGAPDDLDRIVAEVERQLLAA